MSASNWNTVQFTASGQSLVEFNTGLATGATITNQFWGGDFQNSANWIADKDWVLKEAVTDHLGGFSQSTVAIDGLTSSAYTVEVVVAQPQVNHLADIQINSVFADANFNGTPGVDGDDFDPEVDGRVPSNWLIWNNVVPNSGNITLRVHKLAGTNAISLGAMRLTATPVPEPSSFLFLGCTAAAGLSFRRLVRRFEDEESCK